MIWLVFDWYTIGIPMPMLEIRFFYSRIIAYDFIMTIPPTKCNNNFSFHQGIIAVPGGCLLSTAMIIFSNTNGIPTMRKNTNGLPMVYHWYTNGIYFANHKR